MRNLAWIFDLIAVAAPAAVVSKCIKISESQRYSLKFDAVRWTPLWANIMSQWCPSPWKMPGKFATSSEHCVIVLKFDTLLIWYAAAFWASIVIKGQNDWSDVGRSQVRGRAVRGVQGSGPPAPTEATCGKRRDSLSFFFWGGEGEESLN